MVLSYHLQLRENGFVCMCVYERVILFIVQGVVFIDTLFRKLFVQSERSCVYYLSNYNIFLYVTGEYLVNERYDLSKVSSSRKFVWYIYLIYGANIRAP